MAIEVHWSCSLLFAAKDEGDWNGLKLEKIGQFFFKFEDVVLWKSPKVKYECYISYHLSELSGILYIWARVLM